MSGGRREPEWIGTSSLYRVDQDSLGRILITAAQKAIEREVRLHAGYFARFGGQVENLQRAQRRLMVVVPIALALTFTLRYFTYGLPCGDGTGYRVTGG